MAEIIGAIERALGAILNGIYQVIPLYGVAIILLTVAVRTLLIPLFVKQIKGMATMQKVQPEMKKVQQKYKALQQKAKDRAEVQALRLEMNKEIQALYSAHGTSMFGGCLPAISQFPVLIAMIAVFRASIVVVPMVATTLSGSVISADTFDTATLSKTICRPVGAPSADGPTTTRISCPTKAGEQQFTIGDLRDGHKQEVKITSAPWISVCQPHLDSTKKGILFTCRSTLGTGHLPRDGKLFKELTRDRASVFGMHAGCSASQVQDAKKIKECTTSGEGGGTAKAIPYYLLIVLVAGTTWYQSKQMSARSSGQQLQQQQMMTRLMPIIFGFISINFPSGSNLYFATTNVFSIAQQAVLFKKMGPTMGAGGAAPGDGDTAKPKKTPPAPNGNAAPKPRPQGSKKGKKRR